MHGELDRLVDFAKATLQPYPRTFLLNLLEAHPHVRAELDQLACQLLDFFPQLATGTTKNLQHALDDITISVAVL